MRTSFSSLGTRWVSSPKSKAGRKLSRESSGIGSSIASSFSCSTGLRYASITEIEQNQINELRFEQSSTIDEYSPAHSFEDPKSPIHAATPTKDTTVRVSRRLKSFRKSLKKMILVEYKPEGIKKTLNPSPKRAVQMLGNRILRSKSDTSYAGGGMCLLEDVAVEKHDLASELTSLGGVCPGCGDSVLDEGSVQDDIYDDDRDDINNIPHNNGTTVDGCLNNDKCDLVDECPTRPGLVAASDSLTVDYAQHSANSDENDHVEPLNDYVANHNEDNDISRYNSRSFNNYNITLTGQNILSPSEDNGIIASNMNNKTNYDENNNTLLPRNQSEPSSIGCFYQSTEVITTGNIELATGVIKSCLGPVPQDSLSSADNAHNNINRDENDGDDHRHHYHNDNDADHDDDDDVDNNNHNANNDGDDIGDEDDDKHYNFGAPHCDANRCCEHQCGDNINYKGDVAEQTYEYDSTNNYHDFDYENNNHVKNVKNNGDFDINNNFNDTKKPNNDDADDYDDTNRPIFKEFCVSKRSEAESEPDQQLGDIKAATKTPPQSPSKSQFKVFLSRTKVHFRRQWGNMRLSSTEMFYSKNADAYATPLLGCRPATDGALVDYLEDTREEEGQDSIDVKQSETLLTGDDYSYEIKPHNGYTKSRNKSLDLDLEVESVFASKGERAMNGPEFTLTHQRQAERISVGDDGDDDDYTDKEDNIFTRNAQTTHKASIDNDTATPRKQGSLFCALARRAEVYIGSKLSNNPHTPIRLPQKPPKAGFPGGKGSRKLQKTHHVKKFVTSLSARPTTLPGASKCLANKVTNRLKLTGGTKQKFPTSTFGDLDGDDQPIIHQCENGLAVGGAIDSFDVAWENVPVTELAMPIKGSGEVRRWSVTSETSGRDMGAKCDPRRVVIRNRGYHAL